MFADLITEGSWVEAVIDRADSTRTPPKPDLRKMLHPIGPVVVFGASNFPLAYSTAGGDTASALAAGCPVIVKAHEAHAGTNALVAEAINRAAVKSGMPDGLFSTLYARGFEVGSQLVTHPLISAVGFTGSRTGGRALFDLASKRESPIPVFAEMSSVNPIFLLPAIVRQNSESLASQIAASVNLGAGQFCTCPGLVIALDDEYAAGFIEFLKRAFDGFSPLTMLNSGIQQNYSKRKSEFLDSAGVHTEYHHADKRNDAQIKADPAIASVRASEFLANPRLQEEVFGPFTVIVKCSDISEMQTVAKHLQGQLTATLFGTEEEINVEKSLIDLLREKAGRLVFNGVPTGVEVCNAMVHGGPYPATTDSRFTAVGSGAIRRWTRPVAYQNCPQTLLPEELKDGNALGIWRIVDGVNGKR
jgi:NADP-dependent aldehyde dehydrogenase